PAGGFATHLLENGTNLRYIQNLLGHSSCKTTETCLAGRRVYTHVSVSIIKRLESPLDFLNLSQEIK
ncbi:MAG: tyrosine-type recombinase/integrase, partial [Cyclobacteriaceae bacterium]|nr:tyrosine-type recombinase/integrase [Cyclobacteriaceae bacterium]